MLSCITRIFFLCVCVYVCVCFTLLVVPVCVPFTYSCISWFFAEDYQLVFDLKFVDDFFRCFNGYVV